MTESKELEDKEKIIAKSNQDIENAFSNSTESTTKHDFGESLKGALISFGVFGAATFGLKKLTGKKDLI